MDRDGPCDHIRGINLSHDASLLALATETGIEIWDAQIGQCHQAIQSRNNVGYHRPVAFSPKGEFIVSSCEDGILGRRTDAHNIFAFTPVGTGRQDHH